jgi:hypothetical protein
MRLFSADIFKANFLLIHQKLASPTLPNEWLANFFAPHSKTFFKNSEQLF